MTHIIPFHQIIADQDKKSNLYIEQKIHINNCQIKIYIAKEKAAFDVVGALHDTNHFPGNPLVHGVVRFGGAMVNLIGKAKKTNGWNPDQLPKHNIWILEYYFNDTKKLADKLESHALKVVENSKFYQDKQWYSYYKVLVDEGYRLIRQKAGKDGMNYRLEADYYISLLRAGAVTTRSYLGKKEQEKIKTEIPIETKRCHLKGEKSTYLTTTIRWQNRLKDPATLTNSEYVIVSDLVNPASGASTDAVALATYAITKKPIRKLGLRSINMTKQGVVHMKSLLESIGTKVDFASIGIGEELNQNYYLTQRVVGDAGDALCHFLPSHLIGKGML